MAIQHYPAGYWGECGAIYSFDDLNKARRYVFSLMVPPTDIPHDSIAILGVCYNNVGNLILEQYPAADLTLVDNEPIIDGVVSADVREWMLTAPHFDVAVVDLASEGLLVDFVYEASFYASLCRICTHAVVNTEDFKTAVYEESFDLVSSALSQGNRVLLLRAK